MCPYEQSTSFQRSSLRLMCFIDGAPFVHSDPTHQTAMKRYARRPLTESITRMLLRTWIALRNTS